MRKNWVKVNLIHIKNRSYRVLATNNQKPAINTITNSGNIVSHWLNRIMDLIIVIHLTAKNEDCTRSTSHILSGIVRNWWAQMGTHTSLRKKINLRNRVWNPKTNSYTDLEGISYPTYEQYRMEKWKCDKCGVAFSTYPTVKLHKKEIHSYWIVVIIKHLVVLERSTCYQAEVFAFEPVNFYKVGIFIFNFR